MRLQKMYWKQRDESWFYVFIGVRFIFCDFSFICTWFIKFKVSAWRQNFRKCLKVIRHFRLPRVVVYLPVHSANCPLITCQGWQVNRLRQGIDSQTKSIEKLFPSLQSSTRRSQCWANWLLDCKGCFQGNVLLLLLLFFLL